MLHITSRRFVLRHEPQAEVKAYTNAGPATLFVDGVSQGTQVPVDHILRWPVTLREGVNRIEVRSASGLVDAVEWTFRKAPASVAVPSGGGAALLHLDDDNRLRRQVELELPA